MMDLNKIYLGDCRELLDQLKDNSIDSVISDIPYGISFDFWDVLHKNGNSALLGSSPAQEKAGKIFNKRGKLIKKFRSNIIIGVDLGLIKFFELLNPAHQ